MTTQPETALDRARARVAEMSRGPWHAIHTMSKSNIYAGKEEGAVAHVHQYISKGVGPDEAERKANAAGIVFSTNLARVLTAEGTVEAVARLIAPEVWAEIDRDAHLLPDKPKAKWAKAQRSLAKAGSLITLLAEMAEAGE